MDRMLNSKTLHAGAASGFGNAALKTALERVREVLMPLVRPHLRFYLLGTGAMLLGRVASLVLPASTRFLIDTVVLKKQTHLIPAYVAVVMVASLCQGLFSWLSARIFVLRSSEILATLRCTIQEHIGDLSLAFHESTKVGMLSSRIINDLEGIRFLLSGGIVNIVSACLTSCLALCVLLSISPALTSLSLASLSIFAACYHRATKRSSCLARERATRMSELMGRLTESLMGIRTIKAYNVESAEAATFRNNLRRVVESNLEVFNVVSLIQSVSSLLNAFLLLGLNWLGAELIVGGKLSLGSLVTFTVFFGMLLAPVNQLMGAGPQIVEALAGLERATEILRIPTERDNPLRSLIVGRIGGRVQFEDVVFSYRKGQFVLRGISFVAEPGTITAIVGASGSGKSTVVSLLCAFYSASEGSIRIDGIDIERVVLGPYRSQIALVQQDTFLFDGTLRDNIRLARPQAREWEIISACKAANVDEFASRFERGYETVVGERGVRLSGGQRQRVSIARAILANPRILILDEATSNLDSRSDAAIRDALRVLMRGRTTFLCAHRLTTIQHADQILVLEDGLITERGTHEDLFASRGRYWTLFNSDERTELTGGAARTI